MHFEMCSGIRACDGWNITKKSGSRKSKYLLSFPGVVQELADSAGGAAGTLVDMDTQHPSLVLDLPQVFCPAVPTGARPPPPHPLRPAPTPLVHPLPTSHRPLDF
jgi:hypothetical protein